ncbi:MAG: hypothetical protein ABIN67_09515 [Ferruginibacter sp.]
MRKIIPLVYFVVQFGCIQKCTCQDIIYSESEKTPGKITEIASDVIKYSNSENPAVINTVSKEKVAFIFNSSGHYYVVDNKNPAKPAAQFLQSNNTFPASDMILTSYGTKLSCEIEKEEDGRIFYARNDSVSNIQITSVTLVIYKNGNHKIYTDDFNQLRTILRINETKQFDGNIENSTTGLVIKSTVDSNVAKHATDNREIIKNMDSDGELDIDYDEYEKRSMQKTSDLSSYLKILCDKSTVYDRAEKAINQACMLFINEDAMVSVSSKNTKAIARYKIRSYLTKLKLIKYDKVDIEWTKIQYISKLRKGPDGNYYGVISFEQTFRGYIDNRMVYGDVTRKNIEIILIEYKKSVEGKTKSSWDVLLSDIGIIETKNSL